MGGCLNSDGDRHRAGMAWGMEQARLSTVEGLYLRLVHQRTVRRDSLATCKGSRMWLLISNPTCMLRNNTDKPSPVPFTPILHSCFHPPPPLRP